MTEQLFQQMLFQANTCGFDVTPGVETFTILKQNTSLAAVFPHSEEGYQQAIERMALINKTQEDHARDVEKLADIALTLEKLPTLEPHRKSQLLHQALILSEHLEDERSWRYYKSQLEKLQREQFAQKRKETTK